MYIRNGIDHIEAHFNGTVCMVRSSFGQARNTVVTVAQQFDAQAMVFGGQTIKASKKFVQQSHQLFGRTLVGETGKSADVSK